MTTEPETGPGTPKGGDVAGRLLDIAAALSTELGHGMHPAADVTLDSSLERDLGFDSLSRVELLLRLQREFRVSLSEQVLGTAETPRDLLRDLLGAMQSEGAVSDREVVRLQTGTVSTLPDRAQTLTEVLEWHASRHPERLHVNLYGETGNAAVISYAALRDGALAVAAGLQARGIVPGQTVAIMLPTGREYLCSFYGVLYAGGVAVPIYPPLRRSQLEDHVRRHAGILDNARATVLITIPEAQTVSRLLSTLVECLHTVVTFGELTGTGGRASSPGIRGRDTAFIQYTSGSTGNPKGVVLSHANLLASIRTMGRVIDARPSDVFVSWLPLYHDMGLIGAWLGSLYHAVPVVLMSPLRFLAEPQRWLWAIHRHRGTLSAGPNFAYELCLNKIADRELEGLDLGSWRIAFNGAEPVSPSTIERFTERFARHGFAAAAMMPVYGLAECSLGLAFPPPGRPPLFDCVSRRTFEESGRALAGGGEAPDTLRFVSCGQPLPGHQVRVVDAAGRELPERRQGRLEFTGPSTTSGYFRNPDETRRLFQDGWLDSGDLAYLAGGEIYITGRAKDIIIRAGRNIYPYELEEAIGEIQGIRKGCVAVFGSIDVPSGTERVVVVAETRDTDQETRARLQRRVREIGIEQLGMPPDVIVIAAPHTVLKTSSGKIRRAATRELFEGGRIGASARSVPLQLVRLGLAGTLPQLRRTAGAAAEVLYAGHAWLMFAVLAPLVWTLVALAPGFHLRWRIARGAARLLLRLTGTPLVVQGAHQLQPSAPAVLVANHASYVDGLALVAALPGEFTFVAKGEFAGRFTTRTFLRRIGAQFVERFDVERGLSDARRLMAGARAGRPLLFFPEGTFGRIPGLLPFHMGAFVIAAENGLPVIPVTIRGTRSILRSESWFPRRGAVHVSVNAPIDTQARDWNEAIRLRGAARDAIATQCGEPDLGDRHDL